MKPKQRTRPESLRAQDNALGKNRPLLAHMTTKESKMRPDLESSLTHSEVELQGILDFARAMVAIGPAEVRITRVAGVPYGCVKRPA